jgi:hypothetical protein
MQQDFIQLEFVGGPLDGAVRPVLRECIEIPLAAGAVIHVYRKDEILDGYRVKQIMRHYETVNAWEKT